MLANFNILIASFDVYTRIKIHMISYENAAVMVNASNPNAVMQMNTATQRNLAATDKADACLNVCKSTYISEQKAVS